MVSTNLRDPGPAAPPLMQKNSAPQKTPSGQELSPRGHRAMLDDFGPKASFAALNSFASKEVRRDLDRKFVETIIPLEIYNSGPGFVHYTKAVQ